MFELILQWSTQFYNFRSFPVIRGEVPEENFVNAPIPLPDPIAGGQSTHDIRSLKAKYRIKMGSTAPSQTVAYMNLYNQLSQQYPVFLKYFVQYLDIPGDEKRELIQAVDVVGRQEATIEEQQQAIEVLQKMIRQLSAKEVEHEKQHKLDRYEMQLVKKVSAMGADIKKLKTDFEGRLKDVEREAKDKKRGESNGKES
jgi:hypothetical protein